MSASPESIIKSRAKQHTVYKDAEGTKVPGVTTVLNVLAKPALIKWANNLGLQGIDSTKYVDGLAAIGTLAHAMILAHLRGDVEQGWEYDQSTVSIAENCFLSYLSWEKGKTIEPIILEAPLVSDLYRFGGTCDFYGHVDGILTLMDFKTGKGIWPEHFYQLAAYSKLITGNGHALPNAYTILNIPRAETESFDAKTRTDLIREWEMFHLALKIYQLQKELGK
jgi:hypothetical protein